MGNLLSIKFGDYDIEYAGSISVPTVMLEELIRLEFAEGYAVSIKYTILKDDELKVGRITAAYDDGYKSYHVDVKIPDSNSFGGGLESPLEFYKHNGKKYYLHVCSQNAGRAKVIGITILSKVGDEGENW